MSKAKRNNEELVMAAFRSLCASQHTHKALLLLKAESVG